MLCRPSQGPHANKLVTLLPWQRDVIARFFGTVTPDGNRQYRYLSLWVPRRNGKSFLLSILCLYGLIVDEPHGPHVVCVANSVKQAQTVFDEACQIINQSEELSAICKIYAHTKVIKCHETNGIMEVISGDGKAKLGKNYSLCCFDECADTNYADNQRKIYNALVYSQSNRAQPIFATLSSAGHDRFGLGFEQYQLAKSIASGQITQENFLPIIYEAPPGAAWDSLETAKQCNPAYGITIPESDYRQAIEQAKKDMSAYTILIPSEDKVIVLPRFFLPESRLARIEEDEHIPLKLWADDPGNHITATAGDLIDQTQIKTALLEDCKRFDVLSIHYDPTLAELLMAQLREEEGINTVEVRQTPASLSAATYHFETLVCEKRLTHSNNPMLNFNVASTSTKKNQQGNLIIQKIEGKHNDGVSAIITGLVGILALPKLSDELVMWL